MPKINGTCGSIIKRSVHLARNRRTSISLEEEFWKEIKRIAGEEGIGLGGLISQIDDDRPAKTGNLSSAIRLFVLEDVKSRAVAVG